MCWGRICTQSCGALLWAWRCFTSSGFGWCHCFKTVSNIHPWVICNHRMCIFGLRACVIKQLCECIYVNINKSNLPLPLALHCALQQLCHQNTRNCSSAWAAFLQVCRLCSSVIPPSGIQAEAFSREGWHPGVSHKQDAFCSALRGAGMPPASASLVAKRRLQPFHL